MKLMLVPLAVLFAAAVPLSAAVFPVTTLVDSGPGSLRAALLAANATAGPDEVTFVGVAGTVSLASPLPTLTEGTTITGPGSGVLAVSGGGVVQVLSVGAGVTVRISDLTLADGRAGIVGGAAIHSLGTLVLTRCAVVNHRTVGGLGGAIFSDGSLTIAACDFWNNHVVGGQSTDGASNGSGRGGPGGGGGGFGGAVYHATGPLSIGDTAFRGNSATGGSGFPSGVLAGPPGSGASGGGPEGGAGGVQPVSGPGGAGGDGGFASGGGGGGHFGANSASGGKGGTGGFGGGGGSGGQGTSGLLGSTYGTPGAGGFGGGRAASNVLTAGGGAGFGGALFVHSGAAVVRRSSFPQNSAIGGTTGGFIVPSQSGGSMGGEGGSGMGGAIFNYGCALTVEDASCVENSVAGAAGGEGLTAGAGGGALGGAIFQYGGSLQLRGSTLASNVATGGAAGNPGRFGGRAGDARGGGLAIHGGTATLLNSTFSRNECIAGNARDGGLSPGVPGTASGGGVRTADSTVDVLHCTIARNRVQLGIRTTTSFSQQVVDGVAEGGGIDSVAASAVPKSTIVSDNLRTVPLPAVSHTPSDGSGSVWSLGHNLIGTSAGLTGLVASDLQNVSPILGPLQDHGGRTPTHALAFNSIALDAGDNSASAGTDQRGVPRPQGTAVDIGAFERSPLDRELRLSVTAAGTPVSTSGVRVVIEGIVGENYAIEAAATPTGTWSVIGSASNTTGTAEFVDSNVLGVPRRFYKARVVAP